MDVSHNDSGVVMSTFESTTSESTIHGLDIKFPFTPYQIQEELMSSVLTCITDRTNGLLESPSGTGRKLALLCSTGAWLKQELTNKNDDTPRVIYAAHSHHQLSHALNELKQTAYHDIPSVVVASRDHLCINPTVNNLATSKEKDVACRRLRLAGTCPYYEEQEESHAVKVSKMVNHFRNTEGVMDIEDMVTAGTQLKCCPYYAAPEIVSNHASFIFTPYNYLLNPRLLEVSRIPIEGSVIIIDQGHHVEDFCDQEASSEISQSNLTDVRIGINELIVHILDQEVDFSAEELNEVDRLSQILIVQINEYFGALEGSPQTSWLTGLFRNIGINPEGVIDTLYRITRYVDDRNITIRESRFVPACHQLKDFIDKMFPPEKDQQDFESHFNRKYKLAFNLHLDDFSLKLICCSPSVVIKRLIDAGARSVVITSSTLSPLESYGTSFEMDFHERLPNGHVIEHDQLMVFPITEFNGEPLDSRFENRENQRYYEALGKSIALFAPGIPGGILVFFSSYEVKKKCLDMWRDGVIEKVIQNVKPTFNEPESRTEFSQVLVQYKMAIEANETKGAIFFGVFRGKLTENCGLKDNYCRAVFAIGLPYASMNEPSIALKREYLDDGVAYSSIGFNWYETRMFRTVNQAIGRVIRHGNDYGIVLLLDARYMKEDKLNALPKWMHESIHKSIPKTLFEKFFTQNSINLLNGRLSTSMAGVEGIATELGEAAVQHSSGHKHA